MPGDANLGWLHAVLQVATGWTNSHLHHFLTSDARYADLRHTEDMGFGEEPDRDEAKTTLMQAVPKEKRTCRFICSLCLAGPGKILAETQGVLEGVVAEKESGTNGFGYDPIFFVPHLNKTVAQLTADEKNAISHRGQAIGSLKPILQKLLAGS